MGVASEHLPASTAFGLLIVAGVLTAILWSRPSSLRSLPLPPGPPEAHWLSGHESIIPATQPWKVYAEWAKKHGPIVHFRVYGQHTILLSSMEDAVEVYEKRSNLYSDRPKLAMIDLMGWDINSGLMPYGTRWRRQRRLFQQMFKRVSALKYRPEQTRKVNNLLFGLLTSPHNLGNHLRTLTAAILMSITYGYEIEEENDPFVDLAENAISRLSLALFPGAALVNAMPVLRHLPTWFPGAGFHKIAAESKILMTKMQEIPFHWVEDNMAAGTQRPCVVSDRLPVCETEEALVTLRETAAVAYAAGADTTNSALATFFYIMAISPHVQKRAQAELDMVVGSDRLPTYDDFATLPYVEAVMREVLRWRPVAPLGVAHAVMDDDVLHGYLIPKGAVIITNIWALTRDEVRYKDPDSFNPDRFFNEDGSLNDDDCAYVFGMGRRICPGRHLARSTLWLSIATSIWAFNISLAKDSAGNTIPISGQYTDGLVSHPHPYECSITPRSSKTKKVVEETFALSKEGTREASTI